MYTLAYKKVVEGEFLRVSSSDVSVEPELAGTYTLLDKNSKGTDRVWIKTENNTTMTLKFDFTNEVWTFYANTTDWYAHTDTHINPWDSYLFINCASMEEIIINIDIR